MGAHGRAAERWAESPVELLLPCQRMRNPFASAWSGRAEYPSQRLDEMRPRRFVLLKVDQDFRQPVGVGSLVQPSDQRCSIGVGSGERVEQFACKDDQPSCDRMNGARRP